MSLAFVGLGVAGVGMLSGLARDAPALAGSLARSEVAIDKIKRSLGREFQGAAETVVGILEKGSDIIQGAPPGLTGRTIVAAGVGATLGGVAGTFLGGPLGGLLGGIAGSVGGGLVGGGIGAGILNPNIIGGIGPSGFNNPFGVIGKLIESGGFFSRESDRKFNLFNIIDSVFG